VLVQEQSQEFYETFDPLFGKALFREHATYPQDPDQHPRQTLDSLNTWPVAEAVDVAVAVVVAVAVAVV